MDRPRRARGITSSDLRHTKGAAGLALRRVVEEAQDRSQYSLSLLYRELAQFDPARRKVQVFTRFEQPMSAMAGLGRPVPAGRLDGR